MGNTLYFVANDGTHGNEVWKSNGTLAGTAMVADLNTNDAASAHAEYDIRNMSSFRDTLYISALGNDNEWGLYKSNGTSSGTTKLRNINQVVHSVAGGNQLFLFTYEVVAGSPRTDIWKTDGTPEGTVLLSPLNSAYGKFSHAFVDDVLYFSTVERGDLWRTDGTPCGTFEVDIDSRGASPIGALNTTLVFGAFDAQAGFEPHAYNTAQAPANPCGNAMASVQDDALQSSQEKMLTSYPNPFNNEFDLRFEGKDDDIARLRVLTLYGTPVEDIGEVKANTNYRIGQSWRPGIYVVQLTRGDRVSRYRVVKE
jgi:ELWxxDGT repeat protein